jgi:hypothetical protein
LVGAQQPTGPVDTGARTAPVPRPDLAISQRDLPPGFEEAPSLDLMLFDTPLADRVLRRRSVGAGPGWVWTMSFQPATPMTQDRLTFLTDDLSVFLVRAMSDVAQLSDWKLGPSADLGDIAREYTFTFQTSSGELAGDGALALFGSEDYVTYIAVLNLDGRASADLRDLARIVNQRTASDRLAAASQ